MGNIHVKLFKFRPVVTRSGGDVVLRKSLRPTGARHTKTNHNSSPWAFGSGELKKSENNNKNMKNYPACKELNKEPHLDPLSVLQNNAY